MDFVGDRLVPLGVSGSSGASVFTVVSLVLCVDMIGDTCGVLGVESSRRVDLDRSVDVAACFSGGFGGFGGAGGPWLDVGGVGLSVVLDLSVGVASLVIVDPSSLCRGAGMSSSSASNGIGCAGATSGSS